MIIRSQDECAIYDTEKMSSIYTDTDGKVYILGYTGEITYPIGDYANQERAKEVIEEIYALIDSQTRFDMPVV